MDYYQTLEVTPEASESDIKKAYRSLSFKYHPDRNSDANAADKIREINQAYETLSDKQARRQYDMRNNNPMESIFNELFKGDHGNPFMKRGPVNIFDVMNGMQGMQGEPMIFTTFEEIHMKPMPMESELELTFEQSYTGCQIPLTIDREIRQGVRMSREQEKIYVNIPAGIDTGEIVHLTDKGNIMNSTKGDIRLHIRVKPHEVFERKGLNLIFKQTITFKESVCGLEHVLQHIDGTHLKLKSSPGNIIQNGDEKTIKGRGFLRDSQSGDLVISFKVTSPKLLTEEQIALFEQVL